ncbi:MAG TPA: VOC family protein [Cyclobacteriaceae bacterium]
MRKTILFGVMILAFGFTACNNQNSSNQLTQKMDTTTLKIHDMKNIISIVEIPTTDFQRAVAFYQAILDINLEMIEMDGIKMGLFPSSGDGISVQLINGSEYKPSGDGAVVYLNGGEDLQKRADKIAANGGRVVVPKTAIGPEMGFFAIFIDTEGNKLGLYSSK